MKSIFTLLILFNAVCSCLAQFITHGPVIGALTDTSATIYIRTYKAEKFILSYAADPSFKEPVYLRSSTQAEMDNSCFIHIGGLHEHSAYFFRFQFGENTDSLHGSFITSPAPGKPAHLVFVTGSCQESPNMKTFDVMRLHNPHMLIHTGDFTYPSYQMSDDYPVIYSAVEESYRRRYQEPRMRELLHDLPIAYIPDDDDTWGGSREKCIDRTNAVMDTIQHKIRNSFSFEYFTEQMKNNCLRGYTEHFPSYPLADSSNAYYQKFTVGNCDFFFIDTRSEADCNADQFKYDSLTNHWSFSPDPKNHLISSKQMQWLKEGLKNSKADWKFIAGGLPFNQSIKYLIDLGIKMQDVFVAGAGEKGTGFRLAASFSHYWAGFPNDSKELLDFLNNEKIRDVIFISGDTHHNEIDNGQNAGIPEINASGLSVAGTHLGYYMNLVSILSNYPGLKKYMWNGGGGGLGNKSFKNQFGKIEVMGKDFVRLSIIDEDNIELGSTLIKHSSKDPNAGQFSMKPYQKRMAAKYGKEPGGWMKFEKAVAKVIFR